MHQSVMEFAATQLAPLDLNDASVLELGSLNVNGSVRHIAQLWQNVSYVGVDRQHGPGVDVVADISNLPDDRKWTGFHLVVCTEVLEHAEDWRGAVDVAKAALRVGGHLLITTRSPGFPRHDYPGDHWRFTPDDFRAIFADMDAVALEPDPQAGHPGVLGFFRKPKKFQAVDLTEIDVEPAPGP